ncbi:MAG: hypothetical protein M3Y35_13985 [Actinomycetota bacterium]|nr:hypothetical protein [Actinomycetota bacterium]
MTTDLTSPLLAQIMGCGQARADECFDNMIAGMRQFNIDTPIRIGCFLAQACWESTGLVNFAELADGSAYEGRLDLGNTQPGDGPRFKGAGPIQVTGRTNFTQANDALHNSGLLPPSVDIVANPDQARTVQWGFLISCWWWAHDQWSPPRSNCNTCADDAGNLACGRAVNEGDPYSSTPAEGEDGRIAAYNNVLQFGDLALPAGSSAPAPIPAPVPPTPTMQPTISVNNTPPPLPTVPEDVMNPAQEAKLDNLTHLVSSLTTTVNGLAAAIGSAVGQGQTSFGSTVKAELAGIQTLENDENRGAK